MNPLNTYTGRSWLRRIGIVIVALGAGTATALAPAIASQTGPARQVHAPALSAGPALAKTMVLGTGTTVAHIGTGTVRATVVKPNDTITCILKINNPHNSTHKPETVNVVGTIKCTAAVSHLAINVGLYFNGNLVKQGSGSNNGKSSVQGNAARGCANGSYVGGATGLVDFPPGYSPPSSNFGGKEYYSPAVNIKC